MLSEHDKLIIIIILRNRPPLEPNCNILAALLRSRPHGEVIPHLSGRSGGDRGGGAQNAAVLHFASRILHRCRVQPDCSGAQCEPKILHWFPLKYCRGALLHFCTFALVRCAVVPVPHLCSLQCRLCTQILHSLQHDRRNTTPYVESETSRASLKYKVIPPGTNCEELGFLL